MLKDSEEEKERGEFAIRSDACETPIHESTKEDINDLLDSGHEVDDDRIPDTKNKPIPTVDTVKILLNPYSVCGIFRSTRKLQSLLRKCVCVIWMSYHKRIS